MKYLYRNVFIIITLLSGIFSVKAQNINGFPIQVSAESLTVLKFNSTITHYEFGDKESYTCQVRDADNSLVIKTIGDTAVSTNLFVTEGKRGHLFTVVFLPKIDINKTQLYYDFSDLKFLKKLVSSAQQNQVNAAAPVNAAPVDTTTKVDIPAPAIDTTSHYSDTAYIRLAKEAEEEKLQQLRIAAQAQADSINAANDRNAQTIKSNSDILAKQQEENARIAKAKADADAAQKANDLLIAKAKADAAAAQKAEELRIAKENADAAAAQKAEEDRLAKAKAAADAAQKKEEERLLKAKADAEAAQKKEEERLLKIQADSLQKAESARIAKARLDSINAQREENARIAKARADSIQAQKEENARLAKARLDSIQAQKEENARIAKARLDSIQAKIKEDARIAKMIADSIAAKKADDIRIAAELKKHYDDSIAALPKVYNHVDLWKKYPGVVFEDPPNGQSFAADYFLEYDTLENARVSYLILADSPKISQSSDTTNNIHFELQGMYFSGTNCFMRIRIKNNSTDDYLVGQIFLQVFKSSGKIYNAYPCFITDFPSYGFLTSFPVLAPGVERTIVVTTRTVNIRNNDFLLVKVGDRLYHTNLELQIQGDQYNRALEQIYQP